MSVNRTGLTTPRGTGLVWLVGKLGETVGLLNKGSLDVPAIPETTDAAGAIHPNSLNVTRVGGVTALIAGAGAAALAIYRVDVSNDPVAVVAAAYGGAGVIVAAALIAVAVIISADLRARTTTAATASDPAAARSTIKRVTGSAVLTTALDSTYDYVLVDATLGSADLRLPTAASCAWQHMTIKRTDDAAARHVQILRAEGLDDTRVSPGTERRLYSDGKTWSLL